MQRALSFAVWGLFVWTIWSWELKDGSTFAASLVPLFVVSTWYFESYKLKTFPKVGGNKMFRYYNDSSRRCPCNGYLLALALRISALVFAIVQIFITMQLKEWNRITDDFAQYCIYAALASFLYVSSGIVQVIALCQCGIDFKPSEKLKLMFWGIHDIILGSIWLALSFQFHDIVDDNDDSHWRSLFSSMIVFHILSILFDIWNNKKYSIDWFQPGFRICSKQTETPIYMFIRFVLYCVIYFWILMRLHTHKELLTSMGWNDWAAVSITVCAVLIVLVNLFDRDKIEVKTELKKEGSLNF